MILIICLACLMFWATVFVKFGFIALLLTAAAMALALGLIVFKAGTKI